MSKKNESLALGLLAVCDRGDVRTVKRLLEQGVDVNAMDEDECALFQAAWYGYVEIIKVLLKHGANVNVVNGHREWSALMIACQTQS